MTHDKLTALASLAALVGLLSLSAVVSGDRRPLAPRPSSPADIATRYPAPIRESLGAVALLPVLDWPASADQPGASQAEPSAEKEAVAAALDVFVVGSCLELAETDNDLQAARACILEKLADQNPSPQELAQWICALPPGRLSQAQVMLEVVTARLPGEQVIYFAEQVNQSCAAIGESHLLARALQANMALHSEWSAQVSDYLNPSQLFDPLASNLALEVAHQMAQAGDVGARSLIEEGATGLHSGSIDQVKEAARLGLELQRDGAESMVFLTGIVESQFLSSTHDMGSFLSSALLDPDHWNAGDPASAVALLNRIIDDERFRLSAGRALVDNLTRPPMGADPSAWARVMQSESFRHLQEQVAMVVPD